MPQLTDCHTHIHEPVFDADRDEVLRRAEDLGVRRIVCCATHPGDWQQVVDFCEKNRLETGNAITLVPFLGVHPWFVADLPNDWHSRLAQQLDRLERLRQSGVISGHGVGEIGLCRLRGSRNKSTQKDVFRQQWAMAIERHLPIIVHCVKAWGWLDELWPDISGATSIPPFLLHAYGGSVEQVERWTQRGAYFSFGAALLSEKNRRARATAAAVPLDRLVLETDSPYMPPQDDVVINKSGLQTIDGKLRNEPAILPDVLAELARLRDVSPDELAAAIEDNADRLLGLHAE